MIRKITAPLLVIVLLCLTVACAPEMPAPEPSLPANPAQSPGIYAVPSKIGFNTIPDIAARYGNSVEVRLTLTNFDSATRVMREFPPVIKIESRNLPSGDNMVRTFPAGQEQPELQPGESREYIFTWDQKNNPGQQVPYGWYGIRVNLHSRKVTDTRSMQGSESQATRVLVLPPGGAMEKGIELDQSLTADGITVKLEKMEMKTDGAALNIMCIPEDYSPDEESSRVTGTDAQYKVDDGDWKPAVKSGFGTHILKDGVRYIWDLDPVPLNAVKLHFRINRIGEREGFWEFEIQL
ncbi:MAG: hypothetical protein JXA46_05245 [Dehalococcoidales bacterium]|nr:hypothetical protein [Dehalococcoidales bacterium]